MRFLGRQKRWFSRDYLSNVDLLQTWNLLGQAKRQGHGGIFPAKPVVPFLKKAHQSNHADQVLFCPFTATPMLSAERNCDEKFAAMNEALALNRP